MPMSAFDFAATTTTPGRGVGSMTMGTAPYDVISPHLRRGELYQRLFDIAGFAPSADVDIGQRYRERSHKRIFGRGKMRHTWPFGRRQRRRLVATSAQSPLAANGYLPRANVVDQKHHVAYRRNAIISFGIDFVSFVTADSR